MNKTKYFVHTSIVSTENISINIYHWTISTLYKLKIKFFVNINKIINKKNVNIKRNCVIKIIKKN